MPVFLTMPLNKSLHMDPHASHFVSLVTVGVVPGVLRLIWCWILQLAAHPGSIELGYQHNANLMVRKS